MAPTRAQHGDDAQGDNDTRASGRPGAIAPPARKKRTRPAPWSPVASRSEVRTYLQDRIALLSKLLFWIFWILVVFVLALYEVYPETRPVQADIVQYAAFSGLMVLGAIWYFALHARDSSIETLYRIDTLYALLVGLVFGISAFYTSDRHANVYTAFIWETFMVFTRVVTVPSTGRRTAWVTSLSFAPLLVAAIATALIHPHRMQLPPAALVVGSALFASVAVLLATTGSRVIYGLRRQVREAVQLGQYTLGEKLGEGGMGAVYKAHHAMLRRPTAIKLLPPDKHGARAAERFEREVQHTSRLTHPNTVAIFDYGRSPDGVFYYAMEYLDGIDLEHLVARDGPLPVDRVVAILRQVCGALGEAHAMGLVHRDIKPANVLICQRGRMPDVVKVVDFGLVQETTREDSPSAVAGTPAYVSPEAVTVPSEVGPLSDIYSLGAVGYFLLTGTRVFEGTIAVDLFVKHASAKPRPVSARTDAELPAELESLIMNCLAKAPAERPSSADALAEALAKVPRMGDWSATRAREWWRSFDSNRTQRAPISPSAMTISVDLNGRTPNHERDTGHAE